ncbi:MAG: polyprenyl synthetase family protein [Actinobacteria bacterium]|nr:polyprenyl synthetase family protein [Actinomycetota bacterium]
MTGSKNNNSGRPSLFPDFLLKEIDDTLDSYLRDYREIPDVLYDAISYSIQNGGKRLRPVLCLITAKSLGCDYHSVLPAACAIELIHTYSLIHDDLPAIDNDVLRRGKPTVHKKFGEDIAILAGDALFAESFNILVRYQEAEPEIKIKVLKEILEASGAFGMVSGQIIDVLSSGKKIPEEKLKYMHINKTAKLITASIISGALLCNAGERIISSLRDYGTRIGLAFQITDDILDITMKSDITGKTQGKDLAQEKSTYPNILGMEKSRLIVSKLTGEAISIINSINGIEKKWLINMARFISARKA